MLIRLARRVLPLALLVVLGGFTCRVATPADDRPIQTHGIITLYHHQMEIRFSVPARTHHPPMLVIYATGDGGWRGVDDRIFGWIAASGWIVAGFSSKSYLKNLRDHSETGTTTPQRLETDYHRIIAFARDRLSLSEQVPVLLVGNSRGAGLSVVAAGQSDLKPQLAGVIAVALTKEEEHIIDSDTLLENPQGHRQKRESIEIKTYDYLPRLASLPVCVLQSTKDRYLPADSARRLFGPDGEYRKLRPVEARNHGFGGGLERLHDELLSALNWIANVGGRPLPAGQ